MATPLFQTADKPAAAFATVLEAHGPGMLQMPDAGLLFRGEYSRSGPDLRITGPDGEKALIINYFGHEQPPALMSPNGAILDAQVVAQLAGPRFGGQYAQAAPSAQSAPVGQVETVAGSVTIAHANGTRTQAAVGSPIFEGDVVETSADGRISITFADKTVASLGESARIVIDKFVYEAGGSQNSMLLNLVQGAFVFVAGLVAPSGDMKVQTPVATMGIRGTTGIVRADVQDGTSYFTLKPDPAGKLGGPGGNVGAFDVFARLSGVLIKEVRLPDQLLIVRNAAGQFQDLPQVGANDSAFQQEILNFAFASHQLMLTRTEGGQAPVEQQQQTPGRRGDASPTDQTQHAGLTVAPDKSTFFHTSLNVDLLKPTSPIAGENGSEGHSQTGTDQSSTARNQGPGLLVNGPEFESPPISVAFEEQPGGINGTFPITFSSPQGFPVSIVKVVTVVTAISIGSDGSEVPFQLTPLQIQALGNAYDPATGEFLLGIDTEFLGAGQQVIITVTVTIADSEGKTATQTEAFSIQGRNDAPELDAAAVAAPGAGMLSTAGATTYSDGAWLLHPEGGGPGGLWQPVNISSNAEWAVKGYFGTGDFQNQGIAATSDGLAFVFQAQGPHAIGGGGGGLGFEGLRNAFGVKFDTNSSPGEPNYAYARFFTIDGSGNVTYYTPPGGLPNLGALADGQFHPITIHWDAATRTLTYSITSGGVTTTGSFTLPPGFSMPDDAQVYGGFTASGGAATAPVLLQFDSNSLSNSTSGVINDFTMGGGGQKSVSGSFTFTDADLTDRHTVSASPAEGTAGKGIFAITVTSDANGKGVVTWTYTIDKDVLESINGTTFETYSVTISDGRTSATTNVNITVGSQGGSSGSPSNDNATFDDNVLSQSVRGSDYNDVIALNMHGAGKLRSYVDGAGGENALHLLGQAATIDLSGLAQNQLSNVSEIKLMQGGGQALTLSLESIVDMTSSPSAALLAGLQSAVADASMSHILVIDHANLSPHSNVLNLIKLTTGGSWVDTGQTVASLNSGVAANVAGAGYHIYNFVSLDSTHQVLATVAVQAGIDVHLPQHHV